MMRLRKALRSLHLVLGLGAGLLVATTGLTGSILAFRGEIDRGLNPSLWRVEPGTGLASLERIREAVESSGGPPLRMLLVPEQPDRAMLALQVGRDPRDRWEVFVDPHNARILGRRRYGSNAMERAKQLHVELFSGKRGRIVVGIGGLFSILLGGTGLALWWGSRNPGWPRSAYGWHRQLGLLSVLPLTILAMTGSMLVFRPYILPVLNKITGPMPLEKVVKSRGDRSTPAPTLDQVRDRALAAYPDSTVTRVYLPEGPDGTFAVRMRLPEDGNPHGNTAMRFDRYVGDSIQEHSSRSTSGVQKILWYAPYPWHTGDAMGLVGRVLAALSGIIPSVLLATGVVSWRARIRDRNAAGRIISSGPSSS